jgi:hypothetical protein
MLHIIPLLHNSSGLGIQRFLQDPLFLLLLLFLLFPPVRQE